MRGPLLILSGTLLLGTTVIASNPDTLSPPPIQVLGQAHSEGKVVLMIEDVGIVTSGDTFSISNEHGLFICQLTGFDTRPNYRVLQFEPAPEPTPAPAMESEVTVEPESQPVHEESTPPSEPEVRNPFWPVSFSDLAR